MSEDNTQAIINTAIGSHFDHVLKKAPNGYPQTLLVEFPELIPIDLTPLHDPEASL